ncbi:MAG: integration host factor subunit alpha [Thermodesulfobacteriota bacterium]|jgi:integration host factor subunit alpha
MTKIDIVEKLYEKLDLPKKEVDKVVESVFDIIKETFQREDKLMISGFGDFIIRNKKARRGRNPQTGSDIMISPRRILTFKPSPLLKAGLNQPESGEPSL